MKLKIFFYYSHSSRFSRIRGLLPYLLNIIVIFIAVPPVLWKPWIRFQQKDLKERQPEIFVKLNNTPSHWQNGDSPLSGSLLVANLHWHHFITQCDITKLQTLKTQTIDWKPATHWEKVENWTGWILAPQLSLPIQRKWPTVPARTLAANNILHFVFNFSLKIFFDWKWHCILREGVPIIKIEI